MRDSIHQDYFERIAGEFDGHYRERKGPLTRVVDRLFRQGMVQRFRYLTENVRWEGERVLDVGCGPGHYVAALLERGASRVVGIDFAPAMIELARSHLRRRGVEGRYRLVVGCFLETALSPDFDTVLAIGYFDYIVRAEDLDRHFQRMLELSRSRVVASFPYRWSFKTLPRWVWLSLRGCPVRFYSTKEVVGLVQRSGLSRFRLERLSGTILLIAEKP